MSVLLAAGDSSWNPAFVSQLIAFLLLLFVIFKFGLPVLKRMIGERTRSVAEQFDRLESEARQTTSGIQDLKQRLASIDKESMKRIEAALNEGGLMRQQALSEANAQAAQELAKTQRMIQIEQDKALLELRLEVVRHTLAVTEQAVENLVDEGLHRRMVEKYLGEVESAARSL